MVARSSMVMMSELAGNDQGTPPATDEVGSESFGDWLRRQREGREIELREIADSSKISIRYLQAFEENRFDLLPAELFAKGFLRQYAKYVGLDPEEAVNFFLASMPDEEEDEFGPTVKRERRIGLLWILVIAAIAIGGLGWYFGFAERSEEGPEAGFEEPASTISEPVEEPRASASPVSSVPSTFESRAGGDQSVEIVDGSPEPTESQRVPSTPVQAVMEDAKSLNLILDFSGECWVEATIDGDATIAEIKVQGESLFLAADQWVDLKLGETGSVELSVNGTKIPLDPAGSVQSLRIDAEFLQEVIAPSAAEQSTSSG